MNASLLARRNVIRLFTGDHPMNRFAFLPVLAVSLVAVACSGNDGEIKVDAASAPLTEKGADQLFTIEVVGARDDGYALEKLRIAVTPEGKTAVDVTCAVQDLDKNQKLGKGDKLTCIEGTENAFDATIAGKEAVVELFATIDGKEERVGDATWTAPK
jgi:hypothetical protein